MKLAARHDSLFSPLQRSLCSSEKSEGVNGGLYPAIFNLQQTIGRFAFRAVTLAAFSRQILTHKTGPGNVI